MEIKKRESTLEVLRRLQSQNKKSILEFYKKPPVIINVGDILEDDGRNFPNKLKTKTISSGKQSEFIFMLDNLTKIEKKMKTGIGYFDYYYDLKKRENELLNFYNDYKDKDKLPEEIINKIKEIKIKLKKA